jgi:hypothetical protein
MAVVERIGVRFTGGPWSEKSSSKTFGSWSVDVDLGCNHSRADQKQASGSGSAGVWPGCQGRRRQARNQSAHRSMSPGPVR